MFCFCFGLVSPPQKTPAKFLLVLNLFLRTTEKSELTQFRNESNCLRGSCMLLSAVGAVIVKQLEKETG